MSRQWAAFVTAIVLTTCIILVGLLALGCNGSDQPAQAGDDYPCKWEKVAATGGFTAAWRLSCKEAGIWIHRCFGMFAAQGAAISCP